jgi:DMSO reductase family type II enzyme chaperone
MTDPSYQPELKADSPERSISPARADADYATARCIMYAVVSDMAASPFDAEPAIAASELQVAELNLPYIPEEFQALLDEWKAADRDQLKREYSSMFEVGSDGPPVPIREDLHLNQPAGVREDIVRFYEFFGYGLEENFAWAPDHLSVELEFMHFLAFREVEHVGTAEATSFQLAQYDFARRHLANWVPELVSRIHAKSPECFYLRVMTLISSFLEADLIWQHTTIEGTSEG